MHLYIILVSEPRGGEWPPTPLNATLLYILLSKMDPETNQNRIRDFESHGFCTKIPDFKSTFQHQNINGNLNYLDVILHLVRHFSI